MPDCNLSAAGCSSDVFLGHPFCCFSLCPGSLPPGGLGMAADAGSTLVGNRHHYVLMVRPGYLVRIRILSLHGLALGSEETSGGISTAPFLCQVLLGQGYGVGLGTVIGGRLGSRSGFGRLRSVYLSQLAGFQGAAALAARGKSPDRPCARDLPSGGGKPLAPFGLRAA